MEIELENQKKQIRLNKLYEYDGPRKFEAQMTIFDMFSKMKIHKVYYVDEFSILPQQFMGFVYTVFDRDDVIDNMREVYNKIKRVVIEKSVDENVSFAHFSFIRLFVEFIKYQTKDEIGTIDLFDDLIPDIEEYENIFQ